MSRTTAKHAILAATCLLLFTGCLAPSPVVRPNSGFTAPSTEEIGRLQAQANPLPIGERIAFWAERFIAAPYDTDPLGDYVRSRKVVTDSRVDCMYLVFRAVELAQANTPEGAADRALDLRFRTRGRIRWGRVTNYDERFAYAEDMIASGRWGREVTAGLGRTVAIPGSRGHERVIVLPKEELLRPGSLGGFRTGDLVFFVDDPARRQGAEEVGHLGIIKIENSTPWLIHASGRKTSEDTEGGGMVKKESFTEYAAKMKFIGVKVTRFE